MIKQNLRYSPEKHCISGLGAVPLLNHSAVHCSDDGRPPYDQHEEAGSVLVERGPGEPPLHGVHALAGQVRVDLHCKPWQGRPVGEGWI